MFQHKFTHMKIFIYIALALCAIMFHPLKVCAANGSGVVQIQCKECDKSFTTSSNLTRHMRLHTGEKPFKCETCWKLFSDKTTLKMHMSIHTGEKPYKCTVCEKCFSQSSNLKTHMRKHTREKPYECKEYKKCFTRKDSLTRHIQNKHLEQSPQTSKHSSMPFVQNNDSKKDRYQCNNPEILEDKATDELNEIIQQCYEIFCTIENKTTKETPYKIREFLWRLKVYSEILQVVLKLSVGTVVWELNGDQIVSLSESISSWIKLICDDTSLPYNKEMLSTDQDADAFHAIAIDIYRILDYFYLRKQTDTQEEIQHKKIVILIEEIRVQLFLIDPHFKEGLTY